MSERLLTRHFLQRFLENDLISPDADRHEALAVTGAALVTSGLFVTVLLSVKYLFQPFQSPGWTAVTALDDRFLYIASSMLVMALAAVAAWDALALDGRDAAILGPLPIPRGMIVRAKVQAVALFGAGLVVALNLAPSLLHPLLTVAKLPVGVMQVATLIVVHGLVTGAAGAFGFLAVIGVRESVRAALGNERFARVSAVAQASLVTVLTTALLLVPALSSRVVQSWLAPGGWTPYTMPPLWFLGLFERLAGVTIARLPRGDLPARTLESEIAAAALYGKQAPVFGDLAVMALVGLGSAFLAAIGMFAWNARRLPDPPQARRPGRRPARALLSWVAVRLLVRRPAARAGFFFTLQSVARSAPHRVSIAIAVGLGLAGAATVLYGIGWREPVDVSAVPVGVLAVQAVSVTAVLVGFRHAVSVPAGTSATWTFRLAWSGDDRPYLAGVKRAAIAGLILPILLALFPLHATLLGAQVASVHFFFGLLLALLVLEVLLLGYRKLPFASTFVPSGNLKSMAPFYLLAFVLSTSAAARIERVALGRTRDRVVLFTTTALLWASLRTVDAWRRRKRRDPIELEELPAEPTQRLSLGG